MGHVLTRREDWRTRLHDLIGKSAHRRFRWGQWDCVTFAAASVFAVTGEDLLKRYRGEYCTAREALQLMRREGHKTLADAVTAQLGDALPGLQARDGDLILTATTSADGPALGPCVGLHAAAVSHTGLQYINPAAWAKCWRVG